MPDLINVSASRLALYWRCPEMFRRYYIEAADARPKSIPMAIGTACHAAVEHALKAKMAGKPVDGPAMLIVGERALEKELSTVTMPTVSSIGNTKPNAEHAMRKVQRFVNVWIRDLGRAIEPLAVEQWFQLEMGGALLRGQIDAIVSEDGGRVVADLKIGNARTPDDAVAQNSAQLAIYALALREMTGDRVSGAIHAYVDSPKRPHMAVKYAYFNDSHLDAMKLRILRTVEAIKAEIWTPGDPFWQCNATRCDLFHNCAMGAGKRGDT